MTIRASFDGRSRVKVESVTVERTDGGSVTPEDMTMLQLAQVVWMAVRDAVEYEPGTTYRHELIGPERTGPPDLDELWLLARLYWLAYVAWGTPRQDVMRAFGLPRSTANAWIRKAGKHHDLPGPHADEED